MNDEDYYAQLETEIVDALKVGGLWDGDILDGKPESSLCPGCKATGKQMVRGAAYGVVEDCNVCGGSGTVIPPGEGKLESKP